MNCIEHWQYRISEVKKEQEKLLENFKKSPVEIMEIENDLLFKKFLIDRESYRIKEQIVSIQDNDLSAAIVKYDETAKSYDMPLYNLEDSQYVFTQDTPSYMMNLDAKDAFEYWKEDEAFRELERSNLIDKGNLR